MAKKDTTKSRKKDKAAAGALEAVEAVRGAVERTFTASAEGAKATRGRAKDVTAAANRIREVLEDRVLEELKGLRSDVEGLAKRVSALEVGPVGGSSATARRSAATGSAAKKPAAGRGTASKPARKSTAATTARKSTASTSASKSAASTTARRSTASKPASARSTGTRKRATTARAGSARSAGSAAAKKPASTRKPATRRASSPPSGGGTASGS